jgi:hypothetical protein
VRRCGDPGAAGVLVRCALARLGDDPLGLGAVAEAARLRLLLLQLFVDLEEVLDLVPELGRDVVDVADAGE